MPEIIDTSLDAFEEYLKVVCSAVTADRYRAYTGYFLADLREWGLHHFDALPSNILMRWVQHLVQVRGVSARTVHLYVSSAKRYLRWLRANDVPVPKMHEPDLPRVQHRLRPELPPELLQRYFEVAAALFAEPVCTAVQLLPSSGLRSAELVNLQVRDIGRRNVMLRDGVERDTFVLTLVGKGNSERVVPLLEEGRVLLTEYLSGWRRYRKGPWLFPMGKKGERHVATRTIRNALDQMCDPLGTDFSPHTLRRTYAVRLWRRGVDATVIARCLGHRNVNTTYKHYLSLGEDDVLRSVHGERGLRAQ